MCFRVGIKQAVVACSSLALNFQDGCDGHGDGGEGEADAYALEVSDTCGDAGEAASEGDDEAVVNGDDDDEEDDGKDGK